MVDRIPPLNYPLSLLNLSYVKRWVVAPMLREQSVAEHTFRVMVIALELIEWRVPSVIPGDFCGLGITLEDIIRVIPQHDMDEIMSGDIPGPQKSASESYLTPISHCSLIHCFVKVADSIETGTFGVQWGRPDLWAHPYNVCPQRDITKIRHYGAKIPGLTDAARHVWLAITGQEMDSYGK